MARAQQLQQLQQHGSSRTSTEGQRRPLSPSAGSTNCVLATGWWRVPPRCNLDCPPLLLCCLLWLHPCLPAGSEAQRHLCQPVCPVLAVAHHQGVSWAGRQPVRLPHKGVGDWVGIPLCYTVPPPAVLPGQPGMHRRALIERARAQQTSIRRQLVNHPDHPNPMQQAAGAPAAGPPLPYPVCGGWAGHAAGGRASGGGQAAPACAGGDAAGAGQVGEY